MFAPWACLAFLSSESSPSPLFPFVLRPVPVCIDPNTVFELTRAVSGRTDAGAAYMPEQARQAQ